MMTSSNGNIFRVTGHLFVWGIHRSPVNSPHKGQWRGALMFSLICVWINGWVNDREADDLRRNRTHYDVIIMQAIAYLLWTLWTKMTARYLECSELFKEGIRWWPGYISIVPTIITYNMEVLLHVQMAYVCYPNGVLGRYQCPITWGISAMYYPNHNTVNQYMNCHL